jgi:sugar lactone lactonase YvrE
VIVGQKICVADIDSVKCFDKETGKSSWFFDLSKVNAKFLNDMVADDKGFLYVSDMVSNHIFKIDMAKEGGLSVLQDSLGLNGPNGLILNPKTKNLMVVTWESGSILEIDRQGKAHVLKRGLTRLDGMDYDNQGNLYVSSLEKGEIYKISRMGRGTMEIFIGGLTAPADISCDRKKNELLIPSFTGNSLMTSPLKKIPS